MGVDYSYLKNEYPEVISLDQLYQICHISKRKGKWLLEHKVIPCKDSGRRTWRFKIKLDDVITYLIEKEKGNIVDTHPKGIFNSSNVASKRKDKNEHFELMEKLNEPGFHQEVCHYFEKKYRKCSDALDVKMIATMTEFSCKAIKNWIRSGRLKIYHRMESLVPKSYLIEFLCTPYYISICNQSANHKEDILCLQEILKKYNEGA